MREELYTPSNGCSLKTVLFLNDTADAVVLNLHGGPGSGCEVLAADFSFQILSRCYTMAYFDQRGSGLSVYDLKQGLTKEMIVEDVHTVVRYLKNRFSDKHIFLWGGSFGSYLAMNYLDSYPTEVERAIINSPLLWPASAVSSATLFSYLKDEVKNAFTGEMKRHFEQEAADMKGLEQFMLRPEVRDFIYGFEYPPRGMEGFWHWAAMIPWLGNDDIRPLIAKLQIPTQFVQGMQDPFCPADENIEAIERAGNKNVSLVKLDPCGHGTFEDQPVDFCESYISFFGNAARRG